MLTRWTRQRNLETQPAGLHPRVDSKGEVYTKAPLKSTMFMVVETAEGGIFPRDIIPLAKKTNVLPCSTILLALIISVILGVSPGMHQ